jgi:cell division protein FtsI/penicillin-binding protein 2
VALVDRRIGLLFAGFMALLTIALLRAIDLGALQAGTLRQAALTQQVAKVVVPAPRGSITDSSGVELAISQTADDVIADPYLIKDPNTAATELAPLLGQTFSTVLAKLTTPHRGFVYLAHSLPGTQANAIKALNVNGISFAPEITRDYPRSWALSQVLGTVGWHDIGRSGLEYLYNGALKGADGTRTIVNDAKGQPIEVRETKPAQPGKTLKLTIAAPLQDEVEQVLAGVGAEFSPQGATAIAMDPNTGAILALANWPRVNDNDVQSAPAYATEDRAVGFDYEPGSTFKAITVAGALQDGDIAPDTHFNVPSVLQVADRQIHDAEGHPDETLSVRQILQKSSNIGADEIGIQSLGPQRFDYWVHRFGFGSPTGVDLPGEAQGIVLHADQYSGSSMGNLPMGQGESVTLMQIAAAYSAIANGGILRTPHIVGSIGGKSTKTEKGMRVISPTVASEMRDMLRGVLADGGTASGAAIPGYDLAGKTGTANEVINGSYSDTAYAASFIGFVPASAPKLLVAIMVDRPQGQIFGGAVAAPAFQKIVGWAVPYLGINPCPDQTACQSSATTTTTGPIVNAGRSVP